MGIRNEIENLITARDLSKPAFAQAEASIGRLAHAANQVAPVTGGALSRIGDLAHVGSGIGPAALAFVAAGAAVAGFSAVVVGAARGVFELERSMASNAQQLSNLAQRAGTTTETMQGLRAALEHVGVAPEALNTAMKFLNRNIAENDVLLKKLHITTRDTGEALLQLSGAFSRAADGPEKTAAAIKLFGRFGTEIIPFLNQGPAAIRKFMEHAREIGAILPESAIERFKALNRQFLELQLAGEGLRNRLAVAFEPLVSGALTVAVAGVEKFGQAINVATVGVPALFDAARRSAEEFASSIARTSTPGILAQSLSRLVPDLGPLRTAADMILKLGAAALQAVLPTGALAASLTGVKQAAIDAIPGVGQLIGLYQTLAEAVRKAATQADPRRGNLAAANDDAGNSAKNASDHFDDLVQVMKGLADVSEETAKKLVSMAARLDGAKLPTETVRALSRELLAAKNSGEAVAEVFKKFGNSIDITEAVVAAAVALRKTWNDTLDLIAVGTDAAFKKITGEIASQILVPGGIVQGWDQALTQLNDDTNNSLQAAKAIIEALTAEPLGVVEGWRRALEQIKLDTKDSLANATIIMDQLLLVPPSSLPKEVTDEVNALIAQIGPEAIKPLELRVIPTQPLKPFMPTLPDSLDAALSPKALALPDFEKKRFAEQLQKVTEDVANAAHFMQAAFDGLATGINNVFQSVLDGSFSFSKALVGVFKSMISQILAELAKLAAAAVFKTFLKLLGAAAFSAISGGGGTFFFDPGAWSGAFGSRRTPQGGDEGTPKPPTAPAGVTAVRVLNFPEMFSVTGLADGLRTLGAGVARAVATLAIPVAPALAAPALPPVVVTPAAVVAPVVPGAAPEVNVSVAPAPVRVVTGVVPAPVVAVTVPTPRGPVVNVAAPPVPPAPVVDLELVAPLIPAPLVVPAPVVRVAQPEVSVTTPEVRVPTPVVNVPGPPRVSVAAPVVRVAAALAPVLRLTVPAVVPRLVVPPAPVPRLLLPALSPRRDPLPALPVRPATTTPAAEQRHDPRREVPQVVNVTVPAIDVRSFYETFVLPSGPGRGAFQRMTGRSGF